MHWSKFTDCARQLRADGAARPPSPMAGVMDGVRGYFESFARAIEIGQRFYLPSSNNVLEGVPFDDGVKALIRLPFDVISVVSETEVIENGDVLENAWTITTAFNPHGETNRQLGWVKPDGLSGIILATATRHFGQWSSLPFLFELRQSSGTGLFSTPVTTPAWDAFVATALASGKLQGTLFKSPFDFRRTMLDDAKKDVTCITNLCALLNLRGSERVNQPVPIKLARKRDKTGKLPLYDYHVLKIGGEVWDSQHSTIGADGGVRSHLRRGHIRRVAPDRMTWVRATMVHGSRPGFVAKEYALGAA